jgi:hypothetical protein
MDHLAIAVRDQEGSRRFHDRHFGFAARPARWYDDGMLMLCNASGFALGLGPATAEGCIVEAYWEPEPWARTQPAELSTEPIWRPSTRPDTPAWRRWRRASSCRGSRVRL